jgi:hypothetical protein
MRMVVKKGKGMEMEVEAAKEAQRKTLEPGMIVLQPGIVALHLHVDTKKFGMLCE